MLNITNNNFYLVTVVQLDIEVLHQSLVVGKTTLKTLLNMSPLQSSQVSFAVSCIFSLTNLDVLDREVLNPLLCHLSGKYSKLVQVQLPTSTLGSGVVRIYVLLSLKLIHSLAWNLCLLFG